MMVSMKKVLFVLFNIGLSVLIAGATQTLNPNLVTTFAYSPNDNFIAVGTAGGTVKLVDSNTLHELKRFALQTGIIWQIAFSPDGTYLAVLSGNIVTIVEIETGTIVLSLSEAQGSIGSFCYRYDGNRIVTGSYSGNMTIWDTMSGNVIMSIKNEKLSTVSYSPDGNQIIVASESGFSIFNDGDGRKLASKNESNAWINTASFSTNGEKIIAVFVMMDHTGTNHDYITNFINIYDSTSYELIKTIKLGKGRIKNAVFSPRDKFIIVSYDGYILSPDPLRILILNAGNGSIISEIIHSLGIVLQKNTFALSNNGNYITYGFGYDVRVRKIE
jgi:WD40 repeat protein